MDFCAWEKFVAAVDDAGVDDHGGLNGHVANFMLVGAKEVNLFLSLTAGCRFGQPRQTAPLNSYKGLKIRHIYSSLGSNYIGEMAIHIDEMANYIRAKRNYIDAKAVYSRTIANDTGVIATSSDPKANYTRAKADYSRATAARSGAEPDYTGTDADYFRAKRINSGASPDCRHANADYLRAKRYSSLRIPFGEVLPTFAFVSK